MAKPYGILRAQMSAAAQAQAEAQAQALLARALRDGDAQGDWSLWADATPEHSPYRYRQVELLRPEWPAPLRCDPWTLHPLMNVEGLWWRPVEDDA